MDPLLLRALLVVFVTLAAGSASHAQAQARPATDKLLSDQASPVMQERASELRPLLLARPTRVNTLSPVLNASTANGAMLECQPNANLRCDLTGTAEPGARVTITVVYDESYETSTRGTPNHGRTCPPDVICDRRKHRQTRPLDHMGHADSNGRWQVPVLDFTGRANGAEFNVMRSAARLHVVIRSKKSGQVLLDKRVIVTPPRPVVN